MSNGYRGLITALIIIGGFIVMGIFIGIAVVNFVISGAAQVIGSIYSAIAESINEAINQAIQEFLESIPGFEPILLIGIFSILVVAVLSFYHFKLKER